MSTKTWEKRVQEQSSGQLVHFQVFVVLMGPYPMKPGLGQIRRMRVVRISCLCIYCVAPLSVAVSRRYMSTDTLRWWFTGSTDPKQKLGVGATEGLTLSISLFSNPNSLEEQYLIGELPIRILSEALTAKASKRACSTYWLFFWAERAKCSNSIPHTTASRTLTSILRGPSSCAFRLRTTFSSRSIISISLRRCWRSWRLARMRSLSFSCSFLSMSADRDLNISLMTWEQIGSRTLTWPVKCNLCGVKSALCPCSFYFRNPALYFQMQPGQFKVYIWPCTQRAVFFYESILLFDIACKFSPPRVSIVCYFILFSFFMGY